MPIHTNFNRLLTLGVLRAFCQWVASRIEPVCDFAYGGVQILCTLLLRHTYLGDTNLRAKGFVHPEHGQQADFVR
jgi:hypothetical protein